MEKQVDEIQISDYRALASIRYQIRRFTRFSEQVARKAGFEPQQHQLLLMVKGMPEGKKATISELAERLQLQHHSVVELINRLVERGFVLRQRDDEDQRRVLILLTKRGEEALEQLSAYTLAELRLTGPALVEALLVLIEDATYNRESSRGVNLAIEEITEEVERAITEMPSKGKEKK